MRRTILSLAVLLCFLLLSTKTTFGQVTAPYTENFDNGGSIPTNWAQGASNSESWLFNNGFGSGHQGNLNNLGDHTIGIDAGSGYYAFVDDSSPHNTGTTLESPTIDVSALTVPEMRLWINSDREDATNVTFSIDFFDGAAWNTAIYTRSANTAGWEEVILPLGAYTITGNIQFRFIVDENNGSDFDDDFAIDDFSIAEAPSCPQPSNLAIANITSTSADMSWTTGGATNWQIEYGPTGFTQGSGTIIAAPSNPMTIPGLLSNATYDAYVRDSCAAADVSAWVGPISFTTLCASQLSGVYTINSAVATGGTNFQTIAEATAELNTCGVSGPVIFNIAAGTYNEPLIFSGDILGGSLSNSVTFDGGSAATTTISYSSPNDTPTVWINGADWVTIQNLTIQNTGTSDAWGVMLQNQANHNTIQNCVIDMNPAGTFDVIGIVTSNSITSATSTGDNANYTIIDNNTITGGSGGIQLTGISSSTPFNVGNSVTNNTLTGQEDDGIEVDYQDSLTISWNNISGLRGTSSNGIEADDIDNFTISGNVIVAADQGMTLDDLNFSGGTSGVVPAPTTQSVISNNMVIAPNDEAIWIDDVAYVDIYHNSFEGFPGMRVGDTEGLNIRNNIFSTSTDFAYETGTSTSGQDVTDVINYNIYYGTGTNLISYNGTSYATLAAWQAVDVALNVNSLEGDPGYLNPASDLHIIGTLPNDVGDNTVGITEDVDGELRPASGSTTVDIGADEFTPASCTQPSLLTASNFTPSSADLSWTAGDVSTTAWNIEWGATGFIQGAGTMVMGVSNPHTLSGLSGNTTYDYYVQEDCGGSTSAFTGPYSFTTACSVFSAPFSESFDGSSWFGANSNSGNAIDPCWSSNPDVSQGSEPFKWIPDNNGPGSGNGPFVDHSGTGNFMYVEASSSSTGDVAFLMTPSIDLSPLTTPEMRFWYHRFSTNLADLTVEISNDNGANWDSVYALTGQIQTSSSDPWLEAIVNISAYANDTVVVRFRADGFGCCGDQAIDDVSLQEAPTCPAPSALNASNITDVTADLDWTTGGATTWEIQWGATGFSLGSGTVTPALANPYTLMGLTATTTYDYYVRDSCAPGDVSVWVGPFTFTTAACAAPCTYTINMFDTFGDGWNGGSVDIDMGGIITNHTFTTGSSATSTFDVCDGLALTVTYNGGSFDEEVSYDIIDPYGTTVFSQAVVSAGAPTGVVFTGTGNCTPPACIPPSAPTASNLTPTSADLSWTTGGATDANIQWGPTGFALGAGTIVNTTNNPHTLGGLTAATTYDYYVRDSCGVGNVSMWVGPYTFSTSCTIFTAPYSEDFDGVTWVPGTSFENANTTVDVCWSRTPDMVTPNVLQWGPRSAAPGSGNGPTVDHTTGSGNFLYTEASVGSTGDVAMLVSPTIDISTLTTPELRFWYHRNGTSLPDLDVEVSNDNGAMWTNVYNLTGATQTSSSAPWLEAIVNISAYAGDTVQVRFVANGFGCCGDQAIDDLSIIEAPACPAPSLINASNITSSSADIGWTSGGSMNWDIQIVPTGSGLGTTWTSTTTNPFAATSLMAQTTYDVYVRDSCGLGDVSMWTGPFTFTTLCAPFVGDSLANPIIIASLPYSDSNSTAECFTDQIGNGSADAFYQLTTGPCADSITVSTCAATSYDSFLRVLDATGSSVATNDDFCGTQSEITTPVMPNTVYYVVVEGFSSNNGVYSLDVTETVVPGDASFSYPDTIFCETDVNPVATITGDAGGTFSSSTGLAFMSTSTGMLDLAGSTPGSYTVYYTTTCAVDSFALHVIATPDAGTGSVIDACETDNMVDLSTGLTGGTAGGMWVDLSATGALTMNMFDATAVAPGATYNFAYVVLAYPCDNDTAFIDVNVEAAPNAGTDSSLAVCITDNAVDIYAALPGSDMGGTWNDVNATGALTGNIFDATAVASGSYTFVYTVAGTACPSDSSTVTVVVSGLPDAGADLTVDACVSDISLDLLASLTAGRDTTGNFYDTTGALITGATIDPSSIGAGTYVANYVVTGTVCTGTDTALVTVNINAEANPGVGGGTVTICLDDSVDLNTILTGTPDVGGIWSDDDLTGGVTGSTFDASVLGIQGTYNFTYTVPGYGVCRDSSASVSVQVDSCFIGIEENTVDVFAIYPNPTSTVFNISNGNYKDENVTIEIVAINGQVVYRETTKVFVNEVKTIDISTFAKGTYTVKLTRESAVEVHNLIVQ